MKRNWQCKHTIEAEKEIINEYINGKSSCFLADKYGFKSNASIVNMLKVYSIARRTLSETMRGKQNARKYFFDLDFFENIDTPEKAYILGFLYADGWVSTDGVGFPSTDFEILKKIKDIMNLPQEIKIHKGDKGKTQWELFICSQKMVADLIAKGCIINKSLILDFPMWLDKGLLHHFIRGLWDGDGSIYVDKLGNGRITFHGTKKVLEGVQTFLVNSGDFSKNKICPHFNIFRLNHSGNGLVLYFRRLIYKAATIFMERKKQEIFSLFPKYMNKKLDCIMNEINKNENYPLGEV